MLKNKIKKKHEHKERKKNNHASRYESFKFGKPTTREILNHGPTKKLHSYQI
jgi:hypothetical protein